MKRSKTIIAFLTFLAGMTSTTSFAYDIVVPNEDGINIYYSWTNDKTELAVSNMALDLSKAESGRLIIPANVSYQGTVYPVTSLEDGAFYFCSGLKSIVIPNSVTSISKFAFSGCTNLKDVVIPNSVKTIEEWAFDFCNSLTSITIPASVTSIGESAFKYCRNLKKVVIEGSPDIHDETFVWCDGIDSIIFKSQTPPKMICSKYDDYHPSSSFFTDFIYEHAVLSVPAGSYGAYATADIWSRFKNICTYFDDGYDSDFESDSIYYVLQDDGVYVAARWEKTHDDYGDGPLTPRDPQANGQQPRIQTRGDDALDYTSYRGNIVIPESVSVYDTVYTVTGINYLAFQGCNELESITIPQSVKQIGYAGFAECTGLTEITIPAGVELIEQYAFAYCTGLKRVIIEGNPMIDETAFIGCRSDLEVIMAGNKNDQALDPDPLSDGSIHYGIDGRMIQPDTPGLHLIKHKDGTVVKALVR